MKENERRISVSPGECAGCDNAVDIDWQTYTCPEKGTEDCQQLQRMKKVKRPEILPEVVPYYSHDYSVHPDMVRISFADGSTAVYDLRIDQPHPLVLENIRIINETEKAIKQGYVNRPGARRWRK